MHYRPRRVETVQSHHLRDSGTVLTIIKRAVWLFADRALRLAGGLLVGVAVARHLGPPSFGLLNYAAAFAGILGSLATLGLDGVIVKELVAGNKQPGSILGTSLALRVCGALLAVLITFVAAAASHVDPSVTALIFVTSLSYLAQALIVGEFKLQAEGESRASASIQIAAFLMSAAFRIGLILFEAPLWCFAATGIVETTAAVTLLFCVAGKDQAWAFEWRVAKDLLSQSWPLILSGFVYSLYLRVDQIMLGWMLEDRVVGYYAAAVRVAETWSFVPIVVVTVAMPVIHRWPVEEQMGRFQRLLDILAAVGIMSSLTTSLLSEGIVLLLFGAEFLQAAPVLVILVWGSVLTSVGYASGRWLIFQRKTESILARNVLGLVFNIALNAMLIRSFGATGVALATVGSLLVANVLSYAVTRDTNGLLRANLKALSLHFLWSRSTK